MNGKLGDLEWVEETGQLVCAAGQSSAKQSLLVMMAVSFEFDADADFIRVNEYTGEKLHVVDMNQVDPYLDLKFGDFEEGEIAFALSNDAAASEEQVWTIPEKTVTANGVARLKRDRDLVRAGIWPILSVESSEDRSLSTED